MSRVLLLLMALALAVTGCSPGQAPSPNQSGPALVRDLSVKASLDRSRGSVRLPLDQYGINNADVVVISNAQLALTGQCVRDRGFPFEHDGRVSSNPIIDDREYGFWVREFVEEFGIDGPNGAGEVPVAPDPEQREVWSNCSDAASQDLNFEPVYFPMARFPVLQEIYAAAYRAARQDPDWAATVTEFHTCLADEGLAPDEEFEFGVELPSENDQETIRRLLIEVDCKDQIDFIQRLMDIMAQYQAPLIEERAAELAEPKQIRDDLMDRAHEILAGR